MEGMAPLDESSLINSSKVTKDDTPHWLFLKRGIQTLSAQVKIKNKQLKSLQQTIRRQKQKIASMKLIIKELKNKNLIDEGTSFPLFESFGKA